MKSDVASIGVGSIHRLPPEVLISWSERHLYWAYPTYKFVSHLEFRVEFVDCVLNAGNSKCKATMPSLYDHNDFEDNMIVLPCIGGLVDSHLWQNSLAMTSRTHLVVFLPWGADLTRPICDHRSDSTG